MASSNRMPADTLNQSDIVSFSFFQLVRLLEDYYQPSARVGGKGPAADELFRFRPDLSLAFPTSDVVAIEKMQRDNPCVAEEMPRYQLTTGFLGLYGSTSPLPIFYTEELLRGDSGDDQVRAFLDIFHHRLLSFFYRAGLKYRYPLQFEKKGGDSFSQRLLSLLGLADLTDRIGLPAVRLIRYAGLIAQRPHSASALEGILGDFFDNMPVKIMGAIPKWVAIEQDQMIQLGRSNCHLGVDTSLGERVSTHAFHVIIGPIPYLLFLRFLPGEEWLKWLKQIVAFFTNNQYDFDIELQISSEPPQLRLNSSDPAQLGWTTWLPSSTGKVDSNGIRSVVFAT